MPGARSPDVCPNIFPAFRYHDAPAAVDWLARAFGFQTLMSVPGPGGGIAHAELLLGRGIIMLGSERHQPAAEWEAAKHGVYVYVDDVEAHYARARTAGARIAREIQDTPYGSREYSAWDVGGFLWSFGSYRPGPAT